MESAEQVTPEHAEVTCDECFFRRADLCAIPGNTPCPTFRPVEGALKVLHETVRPNDPATGRVAAAA